jgi:hypothetical protein
MTAAQIQIEFDQLAYEAGQHGVSQEWLDRMAALATRVRTGAGVPPHEIPGDAHRAKQPGVPGDDVASLTLLNLVPDGTHLRGWITQHLGRYLPGAVGPTAPDMALVACAKVSAVQAELETMRAAGLVQARVLGVLAVSTDEAEHWELCSP